MSFLLGSMTTKGCNSQMLYLLFCHKSKVCEGLISDRPDSNVGKNKWTTDCKETLILWIDVFHFVYRNKGNLLNEFCLPKRFPFFLDEVIDHEELWLIGNINEYILADITITGKSDGRGDVDV